MTTPPCAGQWRLFDSTDLFDHHEAASLCATCPIVAACRDRLELARAEMHSTYGPQGTWAGELIGRPAVVLRDKQSLASQEARYTPAEVKAAHSAYNRGDRDEWATIGHRIYERQRNRRRRGQKAAA